MRSLPNFGVPLLGVPEVAQPPLVLRRPRVQFRSPLGLTWWSEPKDEEEDDHDSIFGLFSCKQHFFLLLINYVYDQFYEFRSLSSCVGVLLP